MELIQSKENNLIKETKKLKDKKTRNINSQFLVEGFRFVEEALKSSFQVSNIFLSESSMERWRSYGIERLLKPQTKLYLVKENVFKQLTETENPQGIVAVVHKNAVFTNKKQGIYILVDRVQDPGNLGTIIRSAHAAAASGVILTKGTVDVYNEKTLRSTMGSIFNIPIIEDDNLEFIKSLKKQGFKMVVSSLEDSKNFFDISMLDNLIIAVGNEGSGISQEIYSLGDIRVKIPMPGGAESLNAAVAASIMLFEAVRQKLTTNNL